MALSVGLTRSAPAADELAAAGFNATLPPDFNQVKTAGLANIWSSCMGNIPSTIQGSINQLAMSLGGGPGGGMSCFMPPTGPISIDTVCPPGAGITGADGVSCDAFMIDGVFSQSMLDGVKQRNCAAMASVTCKKSKFAAVQAELGCLSGQANILSQQVGSLTQSYQNNIDKMEQDVAQIKSVQADRAAQLQDAQSKLTGNPATGEKGLLAAKDDLVAVINNMPTEVQKISEEQKNAVEQRKSLEEQVETRTFALTVECFKNAGQASYRCSRNGPPVKAIEYILCRYKQNQMLGEGGVIENDAATKAKATASAQELETLLNSLTADAPTDAKIPTNPQEGAASVDQPVGTLSVADIEAQFGDQLSRFNGKGLNIHDFVMTTMGNCNTKSINQVNRERKRANTTIGRAQFAIKQMERNTSKEVDELLNKYSQSFASTMKAMTGQNLPLNVSACKGAVPDKQLNCLTDIKDNLEGLLSGTQKQSGVAMVIKGNNPKTNIGFTCQGVDGCIASLQNVAKNLDTENKKMDQFKKDYILRANQNIDRFTKNMASMMSGQSQILSNKLKGLNAALASLGVGGGVNIAPVACDPMSKDEDGLYQKPQSAIKTIGCQMNPPMLDVSGDNFSSALSGMASGQTDLDKQISDLQASNGKILALTTTCKAKPIKEAITALQGKISDLATSGCSDAGRNCGMNDGGLSSLISTVSSIQPGPGVSPTVADSLATSIQDACPPLDPPTGEIGIAAGAGDAQQAANASAIAARKQAQYSASVRCRGISAAISRQAQLVKGMQSGGGGPAGTAF